MSQELETVICAAKGGEIFGWEEAEDYEEQFSWAIQEMIEKFLCGESFFGLDHVGSLVHWEAGRLAREHETTSRGLDEVEVSCWKVHC